MTASAAPAGIRVFLLDGYGIVRRGVRDMLETEPDITVVGEAGSAEPALARIPALRPDVAALDAACPTVTASRSAARSAPACRRLAA